MNEHLERMKQTFQEWEQIIELMIPEKETCISQTEHSIYKKTWNNSRESLLKDREQLRCLREQQREDAVTILQGLISLIEKTDENFDETEKKCDELLKRLDEKFNKLQLQHDTSLDQVQSNNKTHGQGVKTNDNLKCADEPNIRELRGAACPEKVSLPLSDGNLCQAKKTFEVDFKQLDDKFNKWKLDSTSDFDKANKHLEPIKQKYRADEQGLLLPKMTQPPPCVPKEGKPRSPSYGSMNITSPNTFTPPTTGFSGPGINYKDVMEEHMQYYNQSAPKWYTPKQWAAAQQQNRTQWLQCREQRYRQWQPQYGEKYQQAMKHYYGQTGQVSPLSIKIQPPPPAKKDESPLPLSESENTCGYNTVSSVSVSPSDENLSPEEKRFDDEFIPWDNEFREWKLRNANHPNKKWYEIYKAKWTGWRDKLIEKREQMRRRHEVLRLWNESKKARHP